MSIICFGFPSGDRTLLREVTRQPWLSELQDGPEPVLARIPPHGFDWLTPQTIADRLEGLLMGEAEAACRGRKQIYVLLSGGLDSRIVAGILTRLHEAGRIAAKPVALTWGLEDCRDVTYARAVARILDLEWMHVSLRPDTLWKNVELGARSLGALVSPVHLHAMTWLEQLPEDAIVLAGSYGDSIGRAEFSGRHLLELTPLRPWNPFQLVHSFAATAAAASIKDDLRELHARSATTHRHVLCEHEMQGFYMRGLIAHAMNVINDYCTLYQMFTAFPVYSFMWSLHPACRGDQAYATLLHRLGPGLLQLPWARTNKALVGPTVGRQPSLRGQFHEYVQWIQGPLANDLGDCVDPKWFAQIGVFDANRIANLRDRILRPRRYLNYDGAHPYQIFVWLACFRRFAGFVAATTSPYAATQAERPPEVNVEAPAKCASALRRALRRSKLLYAVNKRIRLGVLRRRALKKFPPVGHHNGTSA